MMLKPPVAPQSLRSDSAADKYFRELEKYLFDFGKDGNPPDTELFSSPNRSVFSLGPKDDGTFTTALLAGGPAPNVGDLWSSGNVGTAPPGGAFTNFPVTASAEFGTFGATTASFRYIKIGRAVFYHARVLITTVGTASGVVRVPVPFPNVAPNVGCGRRWSIGGEILQCWVSGNLLSMVKYDNTSPIAATADLWVSGMYEAAS